MKTTTKKVIMTTMMLLMAVMLWAQGNPVHFTVSQKQVSDTEIDVIFKGKIAAGWHVYAPNIPADGPIPATITIFRKQRDLRAALQDYGQDIQRERLSGIWSMQRHGLYAAYISGICIQGQRSCRCSRSHGRDDSRRGRCRHCSSRGTGPCRYCRCGHSSHRRRQQSLEARHRQAAGLSGGRNHFPLPLVYPHDGIRGRTARRIDALHLAYHPDDRKLLPETQQGQGKGYPRRRDVWRIHHSNICVARLPHHADFGRKRTEQSVDQRCVQHHNLPRARSIRRIILRMVRAGTAVEVDQLR